eukprot:6925822-Pyramimonas_sp.AAC.1
MEDGSARGWSVASPSALIAHLCASHPLWVPFSTRTLAQWTADPSNLRLPRGAMRRWRAIISDQTMLEDI